MDDNVILATSRRLVEKLSILYYYYEDSGMVINTDKTKFMLMTMINSQLIFVENYLGCCNENVYLDAVFTSDRDLKSSIAKHADDKAKHLQQMIMF